MLFGICFILRCIASLKESGALAIANSHLRLDPEHCAVHCAGGFLCSFVFTPCKSLAAVLLAPPLIQVYWGRASGSSGFDLARGRGPASYSSHVFICTLESHVVNLRWYPSNWYGVRYQLFKICMDWRFLVSQCFTYFQNVFFVKLTGQTAARRCLASRTPACGNWSAGLQKISFFTSSGNDLPLYTSQPDRSESQNTINT